jgi:hypothetical protein
VEDREVVARAATLVIVAGPRRAARQHKQDRLAAAERMDPTFLVDAEHNRAFRSVEAEADDVAHLLDEKLVLGEPPMLEAVGPEVEGRRVRKTLVCERPTVVAISPVNQCVPPSGFSCGSQLDRPTIMFRPCVTSGRGGNIG